ncbi:hypothetical protein D3C73_1501210 [compost metagenome]
MLTSMIAVMRLRGEYSSSHTAAPTPTGMAIRAVTISIRAEPTTAPSRPASSGWVESPLVNRAELKWARTAPEAFIRSSQSICALETRRWSSG